MRHAKIAFARFLRKEDGAFTFLAIYLILGCLTALGVAVDYANAMRDREAMQIAANSAALAAVIDLPSKEDAVVAGLSIADLNLSQSNNTRAIGAADIQVGNFDGSGFTVDEEPYNAVRVVATRNGSRGNALVTYMARLAGRQSYDITVSAMAATSSAPCSSGGFFSEENVESGSNNDYLNGFCLYGRDGVKIGSDTFFEQGVKVEMRDTSDFEQGGSNQGVSDALGENTYDLASEYNAIPGIVSDMQAGLFTDLPPWIISGPVSLEKIEDKTKLTPGTLYVVDDVADFGSDQTIERVAVVAKKEVKVGSNNTLKNVYFASMDKVLLGSNNTFADNDFCATGGYDSYLYIGSNIEFGSNNLLRGIMMASRDQIKLGSDVAGVEGVRAVARGKIDYGSADTLAGCAGGVNGAGGGGNYALIR